ncbi:tRNA (adenosine(37)-N6)-threonylcarbamoyltransferase complex ATPase subunit type 1 TsaE [Desulfobulbus rhabdoformis]|uniref:tRNA (adenosine(37)-N6)-threonylcarbamoyltransferase complex ATPase subunit type 1 TsaE n=1 Tax=Desulfobulbus rhabdoformis TaxID=34032 RepID=UPI0019652AC9|nr:tRNA (adenosine(37)-N6)-threonylcarbamoyltransferase complex ATPase subunit type 1 TsaE [Desulfobulbus rhabdoformis]
MTEENPSSSQNGCTLACQGPESLSPFAEVLTRELKPGDVLLLYGPLGAGKTTLTQALARGLAVGDDQYVSSPSFALLHEYEGRLPIAHMDLYRLADEDDIEASGLAEYLEYDGVSIIEWPERLGDLTPQNRLELVLEPIDAELRHIHLAARGKEWGERMVNIAQQLANTAGVHIVA